jgi:hypothetical protein
MSRPEPILPEKERTILLEVYENPGKQHDTFYFTEMLYFPGMTNPGATRMTPEYAVAFKEAVKIIESLVEKGLIDGKQLQHNNIGMYYTELKVKFKGKQTAIREKRGPRSWRGKCRILSGVPTKWPKRLGKRKRRSNSNETLYSQLP